MSSTLVVLDTTRPGDARREVIDRPGSWTRPKPALLADLGGVAMTDHVLQTARTRHGTDRVQFGPVVVYGSHHFHGILDAEGRLALQESLPHRVRERLAVHLANPAPDWLPVPRIIAGDPLRIDLSGVTAETILTHRKPVFFASPTEPDNWGMWLLSLLPAVADWDARGRQEALMCWVRFKWQRRLLEFLGVTEEELVVQRQWGVHAVPALTMHQYSHVDLVPTATDRAVFQRLAERCGRPAAGGEKLFVSRRGYTARFGHRRLLDEAALEDALAARGFRILEPETLGFEEQIRAFRGARLVVGLGGAGMFSTVFCAPGTGVISIESTAEFADSHANLFAGLGHRHGFIFGAPDMTDEAPVHKRWSLDVAGAVRAIEAFG